MELKSLGQSHPVPRQIGRVNWRGFWTLYRKEVMRFLSVFVQTVAAPMVMALLFFAVFTLALGRNIEMVSGIAYGQFLGPGLIMMAVVQNAFANTSSSILISKVQGNIVDVLMPPLSSLEIMLGYVLGGVTRGLMVAAAVWIGLTPFVEMSVHNIFAIIYFAFMASLMLSLIGMLGGIWADKFDHIAAVTNFVITPLSFLSGTFYSISRLPESWHFLAFINPFFYMIDGLRYGFIGHADGNPLLGAVLILGINIALLALTHRLLVTGYKLKA